MAAWLPGHRWGEPCLQGGWDRRPVYCEALVDNLADLNDQGVGVPPVHSPTEVLQDSRVRIHVGEAMDAAGAGAGGAVAAVRAAVVRVAAGYMRGMFTTAIPRGRGRAPDVLVSFDGDFPDDAQAVRAALTAGDAVQVEVAGRAVGVRWSLVAPELHLRRRVIVKLYDVPADACVRGIGDLVMSAFGLMGRVMRERCGAAPGFPGMRDGGVVLLWVRVTRDDPHLFCLPDAVTFGEGLPPMRLAVQRRGMAAAAGAARRRWRAERGRARRGSRPEQRPPSPPSTRPPSPGVGVPPQAAPVAATAPALPAARPPAQRAATPPPQPAPGAPAAAAPGGQRPGSRRQPGQQPQPGVQEPGERMSGQQRHSQQRQQQQLQRQQRQEERQRRKEAAQRRQPEPGEAAPQRLSLIHI